MFTILYFFVLHKIKFSYFKQTFKNNSHILLDYIF